MRQRIRRTRITARSVTVDVRITAEVVEGFVSDKEFVRWVGLALADYHRMRGGHVGICADAGIKLPRIVPDA